MVRVCLLVRAGVDVEQAFENSARIVSIPCAVYNPFHGFRLALANLKPAYFSETRMSIKIYYFFQIFVVKYFGISIVAS